MYIDESGDGIYLGVSIGKDDKDNHDILISAWGKTKLQAMKRLSDNLQRISNKAQKLSDKLEEKIEKI